MILAKRKTLHHLSHDEQQRILAANSPFELYPPQPIQQNGRLKYGVLLIHGLLDSPFSMRDIAEQLQAKGILCRAVLLPGHGTQPEDLLHVSHQDWTATVRYGIASLQQEVEQVYLIGYSTGAALSIQEALIDKNINGIIVIAPAVKLKAPVNLVVAWHKLMKRYNKKHEWLYQTKEENDVKYSSICFNAIAQVKHLIKKVRKLRKKHSLHCPMLMVTSQDDETISSQSAVTFFSRCKDPRHRLLLYTTQESVYTDNRIVIRPSQHPELHIENLSHIGITFSPSNAYYGQQGAYPHASLLANKGCVYGAYNQIQIDWYSLLWKCRLLRDKKQELTYNPDFEFMVEMVGGFITG